MIRRARAEDVDATARIYEALMDREEAGQGATNWKRDVYPTRETARRAQEAGWLYVKEDGAGGICASMILNHEQPPCYRDADWQVTAAPENVLVLHTLCVDPACAGRGIGREMVRFALSHARETGMRAVRLDTFEGNAPARALYAGLGFRLAGRADVLHEGVIPETLVLFEKEVYKGIEKRRGSGMAPAPFGCWKKLLTDGGGRVPAHKQANAFWPGA